MSCTFSAPDRPPVSVDITGNSSTSITLEFGPPTEEHLNGILRGYKILYREAATGAENKTVNVTLKTQSKRRRRRDINAQSKAENRSQFELNNLKPFTYYVVRVAAVTVKEGPYSLPKNFTSGESGKLFNPFTPKSDQLQFSLSVSHQRYIIQYGELGI